MLKNGIFCEMVILVVFKVFLVVKNWENLIQIVPERPIYYYSYEPFGGHINVKVDLSNYVRKTDLKNASHVDVNSFALKPNLANLKTAVDKRDIEN